MKFLFTLTFLTFCSVVFAQTTETKPTSRKEITKIHYYIFNGSASQDQLDFLRQDLAAIEFVSEVKIEYKPERNAGQIRLISKELAIASEGDKQFSPTIIKKTLINKGLTPAEYHSEIISTH